MHDTIRYIQKSLQSFYPESEIKSFSRIIIEHITGASLPILLLDKNSKIKDEDLSQIEKIVTRLQKYEPLQYILGYTEFYGLKFLVNSNALIPRQETEELVDLIIRENKTTKSIKILDIGTGSGCIAISIQKNIPSSDVTAWDISNDAIELATENNKLNKTHVCFERIDILSDLPDNVKFDLIVSNPPYIMEKEKEEMEANVLNFEPHLALFVPDNEPLLFYSKIAEIAKVMLNENGKVYFEINRMMAHKTVAILEANYFRNIEVIKDISNNDRIVKACI